MKRSGDINKYIGIGKVQGVPQVKYISKLETYLIEFELLVQGSDDHSFVHPVTVLNERLGLYLKDVLKEGTRLYLEGKLIPVKQTGSKNNENVLFSYKIEASEVMLVDAIDRPKYPEDIKKIR